MTRALSYLQFLPVLYMKQVSGLYITGMVMVPAYTDISCTTSAPPAIRRSIPNVNPWTKTSPLDHLDSLQGTANSSPVNSGVLQSGRCVHASWEVKDGAGSCGSAQRRCPDSAQGI